jgi:hypothetical protein
MCKWPQNKKAVGFGPPTALKKKNHKSIHGQTSPPEIKEIKELP